MLLLFLFRFASLTLFAHCFSILFLFLASLAPVQVFIIAGRNKNI